MDYQANSHKSKDVESVSEKKVEKVVAGEVITKKKSLGRKFKDLFISTDARSVFGYVCTEVLLPAARNMIVDASTKGIERMMYGDSPYRRRQQMAGPRITYTSPSGRTPVPYHNPVVNRGMAQSPRQSRDDIVITSREEAELVLERMTDILNAYNYVSLADLYDLVGLPSNHTDNKWGWVSMRGTGVQQIREGYLLSLPPAEPI